jgi:hypothetical protein
MRLKHSWCSTQQLQVENEADNLGSGSVPQTAWRPYRQVTLGGEAKETHQAADVYR